MRVTSAHIGPGQTTLTRDVATLALRAHVPGVRIVVPLLVALAASACSEPDPTYACGPVGAYLFCDPDQACVAVVSFAGTSPSVFACAPDLGCDAPQEDYCDATAFDATCERARAEAADGSRPEVSVVRCNVP